MLTYLRLGFDLLLVGLAAYILITTYLQWRQTSGSSVNRLLATARNSATILWTKWTAIVAAIVANVGTLADAVGLPEVHTAIQQWVTPQTLSAVLAVFAVVTFFARTRKSSTDPVS